MPPPKKVKNGKAESKRLNKRIKVARGDLSTKIGVDKPFNLLITQFCIKETVYIL